MAAPMPTQTARPTRCPSCGARIARPELSLCSYCATPLSIGGPAQAADAATLQRLARMSEHKDYAEASTWSPTDSDDAPGAARGRLRGLILVIAGIALCAIGVGSSPKGWHLQPLLLTACIAGLALAAVGAVLLSRSRALLSRVRVQPLQKRPAIVIERRSVTDAAGLGAQTVYFFSLQFADGSAGEYSFLGRGGNYEVPASGATGLACTRGARLLEFLRLRV
jgi:hypothetical protein